MELVVLSDEKALVGQDLSPAESWFRKTSKAPLPVPLARFRKKEATEKLGKSVLKHRLQTLTGLNAADMEARLGFNIKAGRVMSADETRRLAHFFILQANGQLPGHSENGDAPSADEDQGQSNVPEQQATSLKRPSRRSLAAFRLVPPVESSVGRRGRRSLAVVPETTMACRLKAKNVPLEIREEEETAEEEDLSGADDDLGMENPTPAMLQQKRKSLGKAKAAEVAVATAASTKTRTGGATKKRPASQSSPPSVPTSSQPIAKRPKVRPSSTVAVSAKKKVSAKEVPQLLGFAGASGSRAHLLVADPLTLSLDELKNGVGEFQGANLAIVHTPAAWQPAQVFNVVRVVREVNRSAGLDSFLVLVGCGLTNVHMFREALCRQTAHVQFVVFERNDQGWSVRSKRAFLQKG
jgi:hypothetical protein